MRLEIRHYMPMDLSDWQALFGELLALAANSSDWQHDFRTWKRCHCLSGIGTNDGGPVMLFSETCRGYRLRIDQGQEDYVSVELQAAGETILGPATVEAPGDHSGEV